QRESFTLGAGISRTGWNDHHLRPVSISMPFLGAAAAGPSSRGPTAPSAIHFSNSAISLSRSLPGGGIRSCLSEELSARISRIAAGFPATTTGPEAPPFRRPALVSSARPPIGVFAPEEWHP